MENKEKHFSILFIKDSKLSWVPVTQQTQKIRNNTNMKIRELGQKYYDVKAILERMKIQRDTLFKVGKELENQYKEKKQGIHLQSQSCRMKESLICWYSEFFYSEILEPNSKILKKLIAHQNDIQLVKSDNHIKKANLDKNIEDNDDMMAFNVPIFEEIQKNKENTPSLLLLKDAKINQEIDQFDFANACQGNYQSSNEELFKPFMNIDFHF